MTRVSLCATPKITVLDTCDGSPLEGAVECISDIAVVGQQVQAALGALQSLKDRGDLPSLSGLVDPKDRTSIAIPI